MTVLFFPKSMWIKLTPTTHVQERSSLGTRPGPLEALLQIGLTIAMGRGVYLDKFPADITEFLVC